MFHSLTPKLDKQSTANNAVVLFSGGLDSTTCLYWALERFDLVTAVSFRYGQRHSSELHCATDLIKSLTPTHSNLHHHVIDIDIASLGGSALTDDRLSVPTHDSADKDNAHIPITYVPARNTIFLAYALAVAEVTCSDTLIIGVSSVDYSGYPDCRPDFIKAFEHMANLATVAGRSGRHLQVIAPLQSLSKAQTLALGMSLGVDYAKTVSCYQADSQARACGVCDSCYLRRQGFIQAGIVDPTRYQSHVRFDD